MFGFDYDNFKIALKKAQDERHEKLMADITKVKAWVEKALTLYLESSASMANVNYPGVEA